MDTVERMVLQLNRGGPEEAAAADRYLQQLRAGETAWTTLVALLRSPAICVEVQLFAAQSLRSKIDAGQLQSQLTSAECEQLLEVLMSLAMEESRGKPVRTQLALAVATMLIRVPSAAMTFDVVGMAMAGGADGRRVPCLDFLSVLGEEGHSLCLDAADGQAGVFTPGSLFMQQVGPSHPFLCALRAKAAGVGEFLTTCLSGDTSLGPVLTCFARWVRFIDPAALPPPLTSTAMTSLADPGACQAAAEAVAELAVKSKQSTPLSDLLLANVPSMVHVYRSAANDGQAHAACVAIASLCTAYASELARARTPQAVVLLDVLAECSGHEDTDNIATLTFPAWAGISAELRRLPEDELRDALPRIAPATLSFVTHLVQCGEHTDEIVSIVKQIMSTALRPLIIAHIASALDRALAARESETIEGLVFFLHAGNVPPDGMVEKVLQGTSLSQSAEAMVLTYAMGRAHELSAPVASHLLAVSVRVFERPETRSVATQALRELSFHAPSVLQSPEAADHLLRIFDMCSDLTADDISNLAQVASVLPTVSLKRVLAHHVATLTRSFSEGNPSLFSTTAMLLGAEAAAWQRDEEGVWREPTECMASMSVGLLNHEGLAPVASQSLAALLGASRDVALAVPLATSLAGALQKGRVQPSHLELAEALILHFPTSPEVQGMAAKAVECSTTAIADQGIVCHVELATALFTFGGTAARALRTCPPRMLHLCSAAITSEVLFESIHTHRIALQAALQCVAAIIQHVGVAEDDALLITRCVLQTVCTRHQVIVDASLPVVVALDEAGKLADWVQAVLPPASATLPEKALQEFASACAQAHGDPWRVREAVLTLRNSVDSVTPSLP